MTDMECDDTVERVALAILTERFGSGAEMIFTPVPDGFEDDDHTNKMFGQRATEARNEARAAIAAMPGWQGILSGGTLERKPAYWTHDNVGGGSYYFAPANRQPPPYRKQIHVEAIIDVAADGTLAGVEIIDTKAPPPPKDSP